MSVFENNSVPFTVFLFIFESSSYVFSFRMVFFLHYLVTTGWIIDISLREINQYKITY